MITREALISSLFELEFIEVKELDLAHDIWIKLKNLWEGNEFIKKEKLWNLKTKLKRGIMQEDGIVRAYVQWITIITTGIKSSSCSQDSSILNTNLWEQG